MNSSPIPSLRTRFCSESSRLFPLRSGIASRCSSSTATKPGGPPRGDVSQRPWSSAVDITTNGEWAMKAAQLESSRWISLATAGAPGAR
jgi:hypothetical protein